MQLSFVIPAYNEEQFIAQCIASVHSSLTALDNSSYTAEIIVVDNNSTDATAELAESLGASVVLEPVNQISRARNSGARTATGEWLIFIDADSQLNAGLLSDVIRLIEDGKSAGCGSLFVMQDMPFWSRLLVQVWLRLSVWKRWAAGSFVVCRRDAFEDLQGFSLELYAAEEIDLSRRLKRWAHARNLSFDILTEYPLQTSNRKLHLYTPGEQLRQLARLVLMPRRALRSPRMLGLWYNGRR